MCSKLAKEENNYETIKRTIGFFVSLAMIISLMCSTAIAAEPTEKQNTTSHRVTYTIYRDDGTIRETGIMAMSEAEANTRSADFGRVRLTNGERISFKNGNDNFYTHANNTITFTFGLNQNANISAGIVSGSTTLKSWTGFTGGLSISGTMRKNGEFYAWVRNGSANTIVITYAKLDF